MNTTQLTVKEVMQKYKVSYATVRRAIKKGTLKSDKVTRDRKSVVLIGLESCERLFGGVSEGTQSDTANSNILEVLTEQLKEKDTQISKLQQLLENQQVLTKQAQDKILQLESPETKKRKLFWWW